MSKVEPKFCDGEDCKVRDTCIKYINGIVEQNPGLDIERIRSCDGSLYEQRPFYGN